MLGEELFGAPGWWPRCEPDATSALVTSLAHKHPGLERASRRPCHFADAGLTILRAPAVAEPEILVPVRCRPTRLPFYCGPCSRRRLGRGGPSRRHRDPWLTLGRTATTANPVGGVIFARRLGTIPSSWRTRTSQRRVVPPCGPATHVRVWSSSALTKTAKPTFGRESTTGTPSSTLPLTTVVPCASSNSTGV